MIGDGGAIRASRDADAGPRAIEEPVGVAADEIVIGKDVLELVSSAMYVDPDDDLPRISSERRGRYR